MRIYQRNNRKRKYQYVVENLLTKQFALYYGDIPWTYIPSDENIDGTIKIFYMLVHEVRLRK